MEDVRLPLEQELALRCLRDDLTGCSRSELIELLVAERAQLLLERQWFHAVLDHAGIDGYTEENTPLLPETEEDLVEVFGRVPSDEEFACYVNERLEAARIDNVDIEAIALGLED